MPPLPACRVLPMSVFKKLHPFKSGYRFQGRLKAASFQSGSVLTKKLCSLSPPWFPGWTSNPSFTFPDACYPMTKAFDVDDCGTCYSQTYTYSIVLHTNWNCIDFQSHTFCSISFKVFISSLTVLMLPNTKCALPKYMPKSTIILKLIFVQSLFLDVQDSGLRLI